MSAEPEFDSQTEAFIDDVVRLVRQQLGESDRPSPVASEIEVLADAVVAEVRRLLSVGSDEPVLKTETVDVAALADQGGNARAPKGNGKKRKKESQQPTAGDDSEPAGDG